MTRRPHVYVSDVTRRNYDCDLISIRRPLHLLLIVVLPLQSTSSTPRSQLRMSASTIAISANLESNTMLALSTALRLRTGYLMPQLGFGVYQNYTTKDSVLEAFRVGYRHIDSAQAYRNEAHVGEALATGNINREEVFLTTKCINKTHGYDSTLAGVDQSLQKFGTSYIDLFLIHDPMSGTDRRLATYRALQDARREGKIRSVGVSNYGIHHLEEIRTAGFEMPAVNQIELHPFCQQRQIVAYCRDNDIIVQAYCPIIRGKMDHEVIQSIAKKHGKDPAQILLRWSLQNGFSPLPKSANPLRIDSNAQLYDFRLDNNDMSALNELDRGAEGAISWNPVHWP